MKLYYYQRRDGNSNFGDDLNSWLWSQLLPGFFDEDPTIAFIGIGTLLNHLLPKRVPQAQRLVIFGTGAGYGNPLTAVAHQWQIYCLRGRLSAQKLGLAEELAITDAALLVRRLFQPTSQKTSRFAFMPHVHHATYAGTVLQDICTQVGLGYIDPRWSVKKVLTSISRTEVLLAEAMHGAIVADALRIPWIPVLTSPRILTFKWHDWCSSLKLEYHPYYIPPLVSAYPRFPRRRSAISYWKNCWQQEPWLALCQMVSQRSLWATQLLRITQVACPSLSHASLVEQLTDQLENRLEQLKSDWSVQ